MGEVLKKGYTANEAVKKLRPQLEAATRFSEIAEARLVEFESGPLTYFGSFKTRTSSGGAADGRRSSQNQSSAALDQGSAALERDDSGNIGDCSENCAPVENTTLPPERDFDSLSKE